jgi:catechol 2,3-dioxygenase-like lactoylglutathione lyase family enzyme
VVVQVVLDTTNARALADFYRQLFGYEYRPGDEPPPPGQPDGRGQSWLVIRHPSGAPRIAFQQVERLPRSTWPSNDIPQQLHLDTSVSTKDELERQHQRALRLGAKLLYDRSDDPREPLYVYADPDGHPFCIFVSPEETAG